MCALVALLLALLPFGALLFVRVQRRRRAIAAWEREQELRAAERVVVFVALEPTVEHTIWTRRYRSDLDVQVTLPPLVDARGCAVRFEAGRVELHPRLGEPRVTQSEPEEFGDTLVIEEVVRVKGGSQLIVRARVTDRGDPLVLAPVAGSFAMHTTRGELPKPPDLGPPRSRPEVPLHVLAFAAIALATTFTPLAIGLLLSLVDDALGAWSYLIEEIALIVVVARSPHIERFVDRHLSAPSDV